MGWTTLVFEQRAYAGAIHLAFTIPTGTFAGAKDWIRSRAALLTRDGVDEFVGPPGWHSRSVYFSGPEQQVLELIERRTSPADPAPAFGVVCVSEVGLAVADVAGAVRRLSVAGVPPYAGPYTAGFSAVGDVEGMLILVTAGRPWLPTTDRTAGEIPVTVTADVPSAVLLGPGQELEPTHL